MDTVPFWIYRNRAAAAIKAAPVTRVTAAKPIHQCSRFAMTTKISATIIFPMLTSAKRKTKVHFHFCDSRKFNDRKFWTQKKLWIQCLSQFLCSSDLSDSERDNAPLPPPPPTSVSNPETHQQALNYSSLSATAAAVKSSVSEPDQSISSTETLLRNIQSLLTVAADNARQQERQISYEKGKRLRAHKHTHTHSFTHSPSCKISMISHCASTTSAARVKFCETKSRR